MDEALIFEDDDFGLAVGILVDVPGVGLLRVLEQAAAPDGEVDLVGRGGDAVGPDFLHGRVALVVEGPLAGAGVQAAGSGGGGYPDVVALNGDAVDDVVAEAGVELRVRIDAAGGDAAEAAHGSGPDGSGAGIEGEREDGLLREAVGGGVDFPAAVIELGEAVVSAGPDAVAVDEDGVDVIVGQAVGGCVIHEAVVGDGRGARLRGALGGRGEGCQENAEDDRGFVHRVLRYSIRSLSSSLVRSLVRPCRSWGL